MIKNFKHNHRGRPSYKWYGGNQYCKLWKCKKCECFKSWSSQEWLNKIFCKSLNRYQKRLVDNIFTPSPLFTLLTKGKICK